MAKQKNLNVDSIALVLEEIIEVIGTNQTEVSEGTGIARVSLNRYLRNQSEIRLSDFLILLEYLGIDMERVVTQRLAELNGSKEVKTQALGEDVESLLAVMPSAGKKSYLGQLVAYADLLRMQVGRDCYQRLRNAYDVI